MRYNRPVLLLGPGKWGGSGREATGTGCEGLLKGISKQERKGRKCVPCALRNTLPTLPGWVFGIPASLSCPMTVGRHVLIHVLLLFCNDLDKAVLSLAAPRGSAAPQPAALAHDSFHPRAAHPVAPRAAASPLLSTAATSPSRLQPVLCSISHSVSLRLCQSHISCSTRCLWALGFVCVKERVNSSSLDATDSAAVTTPFELPPSSGLG